MLSLRVPSLPAIPAATFRAGDGEEPARVRQSASHHGPIRTIARKIERYPAVIVCMMDKLRQFRSLRFLDACFPFRDSSVGSGAWPSVLQPSRLASVVLRKNSGILSPCRFVSSCRFALHLDMHHQPATTILLRVVVRGVVRDVAVNHPFTDTSPPVVDPFKIRVLPLNHRFILN